MNYRSKNLSTIALLFILSLFLVYSSADSKVTGNCANCHTMHNSQNGTAMATYGTDGKPWKGTGPFQLLVRGDCLGCHGIGPTKTVTIGGSVIPQVYHTDASGDLAGGNFAYILGAKGSGASDAKGHNVIALGNNDNILTVPPSGGLDHPLSVTNNNFRCAGKHGCHGTRVDDSKTGLQQLKGAHHQNVDGKCNSATENYNSYRFLRGVKGLENTTDKWQNKDKDSHNEYFGATTPMVGNCTDCHEPMPGDMKVRPTNNTISGFCGTCHGNFHILSGIGGDTSSPFTRHPTDVVLPNRDEYSAYTTYSVVAPVARPDLDALPSPDQVRPDTDIVMCLSCHAAHGTDYPDILRWDYSDMIAGDDTKSGGCFTCHTQKNQSP